jgi:putative transposase
MARKRYAVEQIVEILREVERGPSREEILRKHGVSEQTYYRWKRQYGGLGTTEAQKIKALEAENRKLRQLAGDQALAIQGFKEYVQKKGFA